MMYRSLKLSLCTAFLLCSASFSSLSFGGVINTEVTAIVNPFNPGPFNGYDPITVSFEWDSGQARDWGTTSASYFESAVDNIVITVGSYVVTGTDAQVVQNNNTTDDQIRVTFGTRFGNTYGTVTSAPDINGQSFEAMSLVLRDPTNGLFPGGAGFDSLVGGPSPNLYLDSLTLYFTGNDVLNPYNRAFTMTSSVPTSGTLAILLVGLLGLRVRGARLSR